MTRAIPLVLIAAAFGCYDTSATDDGEPAGGGSTSGGATGGSASSRGGSASGGTSNDGGASNNGGSSGAARGGSSTGGSGGSGQCDAPYFTSVDKSCVTAEDCVLVNHASNCCGDTLRMAINAAGEAEFVSAESACVAQLPLCGCPSQGMSAEDGTLVGFDENGIVAECTDGVCNSRYAGQTFDCSGQTCTDQQLCLITIGGPAGGPESPGTCQFLGDCMDCECVGYTACECSETDGRITVTCVVP